MNNHSNPRPSFTFDPPQSASAAAEAASRALPAEVTWSTGVERAAPVVVLATSGLLDRELYLAARFREPHRYPRQKNIHGLYYFSGTGHHVWHESQLESNVMRMLDMQADVVAITSQPMLIRFADGTSHIPDFLALHADHRQVVYDVKPMKFIPKFERQFANTRAFCDHVGFGYEVRHEPPRVVEINLSWLAGFMHPGYHPGPDAVERLLLALDDPLPLPAAVAALGLTDRSRSRAALFHLVWTRVVTLDLTSPLTRTTLIERKI